MYISRKLIILFTLLALPFISGICAANDDPKARTIMERVDARDDGNTQKSNLEMILIDKNGGKRIRRIASFAKDYGDDTYKLMFFQKPSDVKNTAFLSYDYSGERDDDQWLYLPSIRKTKRIANDDKTSAFMGSDFSYADMTDRELDNYFYKLLGEKKAHGHPCWLIQITPRNDEVVNKYGYTKSVVFVRKDIDMTVRAVNWVKDGKKVKYFDIKKLENIDGIWTAREIHMTTKRGKATEHKTVLKFSNVQYNFDLDDNEFTVRRIEKGL